MISIARKEIHCMNTKDLSLKLHAMFKFMKREELYEATIEIIEKDSSAKWYDDATIGHTLRTAIWYHDGKYLDLDSMLILNTEKSKDSKKYKLVFSSLVPFQTFAPREAYSKEEALELVQNHTLIAYQIPGEYVSIEKPRLRKQLSIDK